MDKHLKHNHKVSIITVCYNILEAGRKDYFLQMFESVHAQIYPNIEHIIIDGASTDGTIEFIEEYITKQEERYKTIASHNTIIFQSESDTGIYNAMNKGIKLATGEYIIFMNTDDYYATNNAIERLVTALEKNNADVACGSIAIITAENTIICEEESIPNDFLRNIPMAHNTILTPKNIFEKYGYFDEQYKILADVNFMIALIVQKAKITIVPKPPLVHFRDVGVSNIQIAERQEEHAQILTTMYSTYTKFTAKEIQALVEGRRPFSLYIKSIFVAHDVLRTVLLSYFTKKYIKDFFRLRFILAPLEKALKKRKPKNPEK